MSLDISKKIKKEIRSTDFIVKSLNKIENKRERKRGGIIWNFTAGVGFKDTCNCNWCRFKGMGVINLMEGYGNDNPGAEISRY